MTTQSDCRLLLGDCVERLAEIGTGSIDAVVCDPPYEIGFMNKGWDQAGVAFDPETWLAVLRVLKPGGHLLAFGGTRTYHRMAVAIEDAGFEIRDSLHWIYGSGFPKSLDVSKAIDEPDGDHAREWQGWGTALKPAHEPIVLARKPLIGTVAENVLAHGTGAVNIAATRIGEEKRFNPPTHKKATVAMGSFENCEGTGSDASGRWPSNVLLAHLEDCQGSGANHTDVLCAPGCPVAELNEMSHERGIHPAGSAKPPGGWPDTAADGMFGIGGGNLGGARKGDSGGAARFFYIAKPKRRERVGGSLRDLHPTVKPIALMRYLVRLVTPPDGVVLDPFMGSGTTGCAAMIEGQRFVGIELEQESYELALDRISDWAFASGRERPTKDV